MNESDSLQALRKANPRASESFARSVEAVRHVVRAELVTSVANGNDRPQPLPRRVDSRRRRRVHVSALGAAVALAAVAAAVLTLGSTGGGPGVESATAAVEKAATVTAASAEHSGTATVRMTHDGDIWAAATIQWHGHDLAVSRAPRAGAGSASWTASSTASTHFEGGWIELGDPRSIDPDSGTTPAEYLAAVREDVGGVTLRRITDGVRGLTSSRLDDGSTVFSGTVAAGQIARETGFKDGQAIRVLPFGYVAHDEAADPAARLDTALTVGPDDILREITVSWGKGASAWTYTVTYSDLGSTPAPVAPEGAVSLLEERLERVGRDG